jgi:hypothetical protein
MGRGGVVLVVWSDDRFRLIPGTAQRVSLENLAVPFDEFVALLEVADRLVAADPGDRYAAGVVAALRWVAGFPVRSPLSQEVTSPLPETIPVEAYAAGQALRSELTGARYAYALGVHRALLWAGRGVRPAGNAVVVPLPRPAGEVDPAELESTSPSRWPPGGSFEVEQARRMAAADRAGDQGEVDRIRSYLVAEGATDPVEAVEFELTARAAIDARRHLDALAAGDQDRAERIHRHMVAQFPQRVIDTVLAAMLLQAGVAQGWLPSDLHDRLAGLTAGLGTEIMGRVGAIRRGQPAGD